jgi:hypothetical protein
MRRFVILTLFCLFNLVAKAQSVRVVQLEHSLRWLTEYNFPNFLQDQDFESNLKYEISAHIGQIVPNKDISIPEHIDYRLITSFGKSKIKSFKSSSPGLQVAIVSSITRATVGFAVLWIMHLQIQQNNKIIIDKEVQHELDPYSASIRLSNHPWIEAGEFRDVFLFLLDECLGIKAYSPDPIGLGSPEMIREKIAGLMPIAGEYTLAVAGAMMQQSASGYKLLRDSVVINEFSYKPAFFKDEGIPLSARGIFADLFTQITGIGMYYTLQSKVSRTGSIYTLDGSKRKVRLDWLQEITATSDKVIVNSRIKSPITGMYFDGDSLISHFIYYREIKPLDDISPHNVQFTMDGNTYESICAIIGEFRGIKFSVVYREHDELVFISIEDKINAILSLINMNPESLSADGRKLSKNKITIVSSSRQFGKPKVEVSSAELYRLYTTDGVKDENVIEMGYFLMLLFFAIANG